MLGKMAKVALLTPMGVALISFYSLIIATKYSVGHWPNYNEQTGSITALPYPTWHQATHILFAFSMYAIPFLIGLGIYSHLSKKPFFLSYCLASMVVFFIGSIFLIFDPGGFISWFVAKTNA